MEGGPPGFPRDSSCPAVLWILLVVFAFHVRDSHALWCAFPCTSVKRKTYTLQSATPDIFLSLVWPISRSLATTSEISVDFSSSPYLDVSVQAVPRVRLFDSTHADRVLLCRVSPFGNLRVKAYVQLTAAYRSLSRPSSAPDAKAFALCSFSLELPTYIVCSLNCLSFFVNKINFALKRFILFVSFVFHLSVKLYRIS